LPFAAGQVDACEDVQWLQPFAYPPVELIGDDPQRERVTRGGVQESCVLLIGGEGKRGEPAMPMLDGDGVAMTDSESRSFLEESTGKGSSSPKSDPHPKGCGWRMPCSTMGSQVS